MAAVSESIVREYFELHGFFVRQQRKFIARIQAEDDESDFLVFNPNVQVAASLPFVLGSADLAGVSRAVVAVKGWHSDTFSKSVDGVIPFRTMLQDLIDQIEINRNYQKADLLQIIRILKNYDFFKENQLELFKGKRKAAARKAD